MVVVLPDRCDASCDCDGDEPWSAGARRTRAGLLATPRRRRRDPQSDRACYADPSIRKDTVSWTRPGFTPGAAVPARRSTVRRCRAVVARATPTPAARPPGASPHRRSSAGRCSTRSRWVLEGANEPTTTFTVSKLRATFSPASGNPRTLRVRFSASTASGCRARRSRRSTSTTSGRTAACAVVRPARHRRGPVRIAAQQRAGACSASARAAAAGRCSSTPPRSTCDRRRPRRSCSTACAHVR